MSIRKGEAGYEIWNQDECVLRCTSEAYAQEQLVWLASK